ncbi:MAG: cytochrome B [Betaproteobacteria bacterium]|nr:cytochrome B [Betaproteobacteria bacterium]NBT75567.1 cytochrome B [Betaproteobacteria bacterium]NBY14614.1 cytochrome B [Betaproteobacteria bacterium]NCA15452.1 cytochrome B [Betaproteobacteria bacterium]
MATSSDRPIAPLYVRVTHWLNAIAVVIMVLSGLRIYNASPIFDFLVPRELTLGGWLGGALLWHFAFMWLLVVNGLFYLTGNIVTGRLSQKFFPLRPKELLEDVLNTLRGKLSHEDLSHYNTIQKLAYLAIILDVVILVLSGLAIWKPVQFSTLSALMGGFDSARVVHFLSMTFAVFFLVVHIIMVALVPKTLLIMTRGR